MSAHTLQQIGQRMQAALQGLAIVMAHVAHAHRTRFPVPPGLGGCALNLLLMMLA